jgi:hypothetical protein
MRFARRKFIAGLILLGGNAAGSLQPRKSDRFIAPFAPARVRFNPEMEGAFVMVLRARIAARLGWLASLVAALWMAAVAPTAAATSSAHVYLLRGLLNMSPGFDTLAASIRNRGIPATLDSYGSWSALAQDAMAQYKRGRLRSIVIIGHSAGGGAALDMAAALGRAGIPVNLVIAIDPTGTTAVPGNVRRTVNLYVAGGLGSPVGGAAKTRGAIQNLADRDPRIGHFSIIGAHERQIIGYVLSATRFHAEPAAAATASDARTHGAAN